MRKTTLATQLSSLSGFSYKSLYILKLLNFLKENCFRAYRKLITSGLQKIDHVINWCKRPIASQTLHTKDSNCAR